MSRIFDEFEKRTSVDFTLFISFMEIYNEHAYDLLERKNLETPIENWNKVTEKKNIKGICIYINIGS